MQKIKDRHFNENLYQIFFLLNSSLPIFVVNILFYKNRGLNFKEIMLLQAISAAAVILLEVPSGILADRYSRKMMILIGMLCSVIGLLLMLISKRYIGFAAAAFFGGVGEASISGSDMAMIYDHFKWNKKEEFFEKYLASMNSKQFILFSASTLVGGSLFAYNPDLILLISLGFQIVAASSIFFFKENFKKDNRQSMDIKRKIIEHFNILKQKELFSIVILFLIMTLAISTLNQLTQQYLVEINFNINFLGLLFFVFNIISAIGSKYYLYTKKIGAAKIILLFSAIMFSLSLIYNIGAIIILLVARFFSSGIWPFLNSELNKLIESKDRASIISYKSLLISISFVIFDPINGVIIDLKNVHYLYMIFSGVLFLYFIRFSYFKTKWSGLN
jgi:hypothetical protein